MTTIHEAMYTQRALRLVKRERVRQIQEEGHAPSDDDTYVSGALGLAAASYAIPPDRRPAHLNATPGYWPWGRAYWKPGPTRLRELEKAGALILAEIERLLRERDRGT